MSQVLKDIDEAWLGISVKDEELFNPTSIFDSADEDFHLMLARVKS